MKNDKTYRIVITIIIAAFALVTIFMSSAVLFDWFGIRIKQGHYTPFIVETNFFLGFLYLAVAYGFMKSKKWPFWGMICAALLLSYAFGIFYLYVHTGQLYERHTIFVMGFRILFTVLLAVLIYRSNNRIKIL